MWTMTTRGFYSAVQHRDHPDRLLIRARCEEDIRNLADLLPGCEPWPLDNSDYRWRLECSKDEWTAALAILVADLDYPNFKNAVEDLNHRRAYIEVWHDLLPLADGAR